MSQPKTFAPLRICMHASFLPYVSCDTGCKHNNLVIDKSSKHKNYETDEEPPQMDLATLAKAKLLAKDIGK